MGDVTIGESMRAGMNGATSSSHRVSRSMISLPAGIARAETVNVGGTRNVLELAVELGVPRIVSPALWPSLATRRAKFPTRPSHAGRHSRVGA